MKKDNFVIYNRVSSSVLFDLLIGLKLPLNEKEANDLLNKLSEGLKMRYSGFSNLLNVNYEDQNRDRIVFDFFSNVFSDNFHSLFIYDLKSERVILNFEEILEHFGYTQDLVKNEHFLRSIIPAQDYVNVNLFFRQFNEIEPDRIHPFEFRLVDRKGNYHYLKSRNLILSRDNSGKAWHILGTLDDITNQYIEHAESGSVQLYADLVSNQSAGVYRLFIKAGFNPEFLIESTTLEFVSDRFCQLLGISPLSSKEVLINDIIRLIHPSDLQEFFETNVQAQQNLTPYVKTFRFIVNGRIKYFRFESNPRTLTDGSVRWTGVMCDDTERHELEEYLNRRVKELEVYYDLAIQREKKMIALKDEINDLLKQLGRDPKY